MQPRPVPSRGKCRGREQKNINSARPSRRKGKVLFMAILTLNQELKGIEISFNAKPAATILASLKAAGFRWHNVKKVWYAKQTDARLDLAKQITGTDEAAEAPKAAPAKAAEKINLDGLGENKPSLYGAELAKAIREDLKRRGVTGVTVRARKVTYETGITCTIKATPADIASLEEIQTRYTFEEFSCDAKTDRGLYDGSRNIYNYTWEGMTDEERRAAYDSYCKYTLEHRDNFNHYHQDRNLYPYYTTAFFNKIKAVFAIANQWNYDHSDSMTDYFDVGYYLDIDIKRVDDFEPRLTMTDAEKAAYKAEKEAEEKEYQERLERYKKEQEERERQYKEAEARHQADLDKITGQYDVVDLTGEGQRYITGLAGGIGKECTLAELDEAIKERETGSEEALVTRKVVFKTLEAFESFGRCLLDDFSFLEGKGGTATEDVRLEGVDFYKLNTEQRESVKFYLNDCVAIYAGEKLQLVIDPEGYSYARYCFRPTENTHMDGALAVLQMQKADSETKPAFHFPEPIEKQAQILKPLQAVTVYQCDGWLLNSIYAGAGIIKDVKPGNYAQYTGVYIEFLGGKSVFLRDGKKALVYEGIKPALPDEVTSRRISENMKELLNVDELLPNTYEYYKAAGEEPIIDTWQR